MTMLEGRLLQDQGDAGGAWAAFERAGAVDPHWMEADPDDAARFARAADEAGQTEVARQAYIKAVYITADQSWERPELYLRYADLLRRLGLEARERGFGDEADANEREADLWYHRVLAIVDPRDLTSLPDLEAARRKLSESHAEAITQGSANYAVFLEGRGRIEGAMRQLLNAHYQSATTASGTGPLRPSAAAILEPFMSWALRKEQWHDVLGAWANFGSSLAEGPTRWRCLGYVARSLSALGLNEEALELIQDLEQKSPEGGSSTGDLLYVWKAEILSRMGRGKETIERLVALRRTDNLTNIRVNALRVLADVYEREERRLEAAQTFEELASTIDLGPEQRAEAWLRAGALYLQQAMPEQTVEIGLRALYFETELTPEATGPLWDPTTTIRLRLLLARAYHAAGKFAESATTLESCLAMKGLAADERGFAQCLLGRCRRGLGQIEGARLAFQTAEADASIPEVWRKAAAEALDAMGPAPEPSNGPAGGVAASGAQGSPPATRGES